MPQWRQLRRKTMNGDHGPTTERAPNTSPQWGQGNRQNHRLVANPRAMSTRSTRKAPSPRTRNAAMPTGSHERKLSANAQRRLRRLLHAKRYGSGGPGGLSAGRRYGSMLTRAA